MHVLDTSDPRGGYVLDCDSGLQIRLSHVAYTVVAAVWRGASFDEIANAHGAAEQKVSADDVGRVYERVIARVASMEAQRRARRIDRGFFLRMTLIPAALVRIAAAPVAPLFQPAVALLGALLIALAAAIFCFAAPYVEVSKIPGSQLLAGLGLFLISCVAHELGHAGACLRFGVRPGSIGLGLYLAFPVLYSDVSRIWRLHRWQRVAVDVGGSYVQCLCGAMYVMLYLHAHCAALIFATALIISATLLNMNPLFRFDGYWIVADSLGVTGLHAHAAAVIRNFALRCAGREHRAGSRWPRHVGAIVTTYAFGALIGWAFFVTRLVESMLAKVQGLLTSSAAVRLERAGLPLGLVAVAATLIVAALTLAFLGFKVWRFMRVDPVR